MTAGLQSSARATSHQATETKNRSVLVIGAGIAGLAAARKLKSAGYSVTIIEARDRIGGRIWTSTYWPDTPLDLGASWIHGEQGNPLTDLANSIAAERVATHYEVAQAYNTNGHPLTQGEEARLETLKDSLFDAISEAQAGETDQTIRDVATNWATERNANAETRRWINFILSGSIEQEYAGSAESLSGFWFDGSKTYPGDDALFVEGFRVIVDHLSKGLDIRLGEVVKEISWQTHPIAVVTDRQEFSADYVLVTLPLGVLKTAAVTFSPALPVKKQNAIRALAMGVLNKCYLRFEKAFWPQDVDWLEYIPAKHGAWTEWVSFMRTTNQPILLGFNAADYGRQIENWSGEAIVADAMSTLRTIYGRDVPEPIDYQITRWAKDPYALGSYSYNPVGSHPRQRKHLARPEGRMFFAGEATEENYFASAHGAYMSGLRAAAEIMQA